MTRLFEHLNYTGRRDAIFEQLEQNPINERNEHRPMKNLKNFIKLFLLNKEHTDTNSLSDTYNGNVIERLINRRSTTASCSEPLDLS